MDRSRRVSPSVLKEMEKFIESGLSRISSRNPTMAASHDRSKWWVLKSGAGLFVGLIITHSNFAALEVYKGALDLFIEHSRAYAPILSEIKSQYDNALALLQQESSQL